MGLGAAEKFCIAVEKYESHDALRGLACIHDLATKKHSPQMLFKHHFGLKIAANQGCDNHIGRQISWDKTHRLKSLSNSEISPVLVDFQALEKAPQAFHPTLLGRTVGGWGIDGVSTNGPCIAWLGA